MWHGAAALFPHTTTNIPGYAPSSASSTLHRHVLRTSQDAHIAASSMRRKGVVVMVRAAGSAGAGAGDDQTFLTLEEAGLIELSNLDMHERFLCRLTVSSLNLLRVVSKQEGIPIEQLNAGIICDWFQKDKEKREKDFDSATLKW